METLKTRIIDRFLGSAAAREIEREEIAEWLEQRRKDVEGLRAVRAENDAAVLAADQYLLTAKAQYDAAKKPMTAAEENLAAAERARRCASFDRTAALAKAEAGLRATAPIVLDDFELWLLAESDKLRTAVSFGVKFQDLAGGRRGVVRSNVEGVEYRQKLIARALQRLSYMRLEVSDRVEVEIADLKTEIQTASIAQSTKTIADPIAWENPNRPPKEAMLAVNEFAARLATYR